MLNFILDLEVELRAIPQLVARPKIGIFDPAESRTWEWVIKWAYQGPRH